MKDEIIINGSDLELQKFSDGKSGMAKDPETERAVKDFMDLFLGEHGIKEK